MQKISGKFSHAVRYDKGDSYYEIELLSAPNLKTIDLYDWGLTGDSIADIIFTINSKQTTINCYIPVRGITIRVLPYMHNQVIRVNFRDDINIISLCSNRRTRVLVRNEVPDEITIDDNKIILSPIKITERT